MSGSPDQRRRHRRALTARIGAQRERFARELGALRRPLQAFEVARGAGEVLARHVWLSGAVAACAGFLLWRGGALVRARRALQLAARAARGWMLARLSWRRLRGPA